MKHYTTFYKGYPLIACFDDVLYMCVYDATHYIVYNEHDNYMIVNCTYNKACAYMWEKSNEFGFYTEDVNECMEYLKIL